MVDINIGNVVTIALISVVGYAAVKAGLKAAGVQVDWL